jgi:type IV pilus assembly protein PilY1
MKIKLTVLLILPMLLLSTLSSHSDDTEIYLNNDAVLAGAPLIMLTLDYRPNLTASVCGGYDPTDATSNCFTTFWKCTEFQTTVETDEETGEETTVFARDAQGNKICIADTNNNNANSGWVPWLPDPDSNQPDRNPIIPVDPDAVNFFEIFVAALNRVFEGLLEEKGEGKFRLGMMLNNADTTTGQCGAGQGVAGRNDNQKCSNGGFVFLGFNDFTYEYKTQFIVKLLSLLPVLPQGNVSHSFQGAELYMELFRYLTGQDVLNAHNGYDNYGFSATGNNPPQNVGYTLGFTGDDVPRIIIPDSNDADSNAFVNPQIGWDATIETAYSTSSTTSLYVSSLTSSALTPIGLSSIAAPPAISYTPPDAIGTDIDEAISNSLQYRYNSPLFENCSRVYVLNFMFAVSNQENESDDFIEAARTEQGLGITVSASDAFADVIGELYRTDLADPDNPYNAALGPVANGGTGQLDLLEKQNVTSYFFVDPSQLQQATQKGYALAGNTVVPRALSSDPDQLVEDISNTLSSILSISTTFVSATVPVNVFNRSESLDNVFFGVFQAEEDEQWPGNVKRLKLQVNADSQVLQVVDANCTDQNCVDAISEIDGRIRNDALTFWTDANGVDVSTELGSNSDRPLNGYDTEKDEVSTADGRSVNRGGAGQQLQGFINSSNDAPTSVNTGGNGRTLYSASVTQSGVSRINFDADTATASQLWDNYLCHAVQGDTCDTSWDGAASTDSNSPGVDATSTSDQEAATKLIAFHRGVDVYDSDNDNSNSDARPWMFADILHSQPVPINYGIRGGYSESNSDLRILVASNDGYVRMIRNNTTCSGDGCVGDPDGSEDWAFIPPEVLPNLGVLANNTGLSEHPYGVDGTISLYSDDTNNDGTLDSSDGDKVYAYFGMRRGGYSYYALDISDPDDPSVLWRLDNTNSDFTQMGQTWSRPAVRMLDWGDGIKPVVIFAGGYDTRKDDDSELTDAAADDTVGNAVFIVDAETGELVWKVVRGDPTGTPGNVSSTEYNHPDLRDSIPSDVTPIDANGDTIVDRVYVGDTGGVVWRIDMVGTDRSSWQITPMLNAGRHASGHPDRRFFHRPDIVPSFDVDALNNVPFDGILIGSGNRPDPRSEYGDDDSTDRDQFYMLKDLDTVLYPVPEVIRVADATTPDEMADLTNAGVSQADGGGIGQATTTSTTQIACEDPAITDFADPGCVPVYEEVTTDDFDTLELDCTLAENDCDTFAVGWFIDFTTRGEKLLASSLTFLGKVFFSTYIPSGGEEGGWCAPPEGQANSYAINLVDASPEYGFAGTSLAQQRATITGGGIPSDPVIVALDGNIYVTPGNIPTTPEFREKVAGNPLRQTFWYELEN